MADSFRDRDDLGRLAQSARSAQLKSARNMLFFVGGWLFFSLIIEWFMIQGDVNRLGGWNNLPDFITNQLYLIFGGYIVLGIVYIAFGFLVKDYPVPITVTALVLFVGLLVVVSVNYPESLKSGLIVKIIVIVGLSKSIQAAIAYQAELNAEKEGRGGDSFDRYRGPSSRDDRDDDRRDRDDDRDDRRDRPEYDDRRDDRRRDDRKRSSEDW